jgi:hypothetical protein
LAAAVLAAGFSIPSAFAQCGRDDLPLPDNVGDISEGIEIRTIAVAGHLGRACPSAAHDLSVSLDHGERGRRSWIERGFAPARAAGGVAGMEP